MEYNIKTVFCILLPLLFSLSIGAEDKYTFTPTTYKLNIITTEKNFEDDVTQKFTGKVEIEFEITKPKEEKEENVNITLNTNSQMKLLQGNTLKGISGTDLISVEADFHHENDTLIIKVKKQYLNYGKYRLTVNYENPLRDDMTGFYRSSYVDSSNKRRWLLTTHFEPIYARQAFPCFDYPNLKAVFEVIITAPASKNVLCNTPTECTTQGNNKIFTCKKTLQMSTYLVAFTVSDFIGTTSEEFSSNYPSESKRKLTTYGQKDIIESGNGKFAQKRGIAAITKLGEYLDIGYAFEKVDLVGIPDFSAGAMENWGHISFREKCLFFNGKTGSTNTKQSCALTITHELVHQWFGNLVTLESWNYIWLNEAFANYLEYVIISKIPETSIWNVMKQFVVVETHLRAFETDGLHSSKPLNQNITDENLIDASFNDIPYAKGASVLRMWENALGSEKFQKSLQKYLKGRQLKSANPDQLYEYFKSEAEMKPEFFSTWTKQAGYPVVEVKKNKTGIYTLTQKRFLWNKGDNSSQSSWYIPITYTSDNLNKWDTQPAKWLYNEPLDLNITGKWIVINNQQSGYYRVNYDQENWNALSEALQTNHSVIDEINRAQIINDVYSLARSLQDTYVKYPTALALTKYLNKEQSYYPWKTALNAFNFLRTKLRQEEFSDRFSEYVLSLIKPHFEKLKLNAEDHVDKLKNVEFFRWACSLGDKDCLKTAQKLYRYAIYSSLPDFQEVVLCTVINEANVWDEIFELYLKENDSALKLMYISALGCTSNSTKAKEFLEQTLRNNSSIRKQDLSYVLSSVYNGNLNNIDLAFDFIEKNYMAIAKTYGGLNPLGKAFVGIASKLNSEKEYERLKKLIDKVKNEDEGKAAKDSLENALNIAKSNTEWVNQRMGQIREYFNAGSFVTYSLGLMSLCLAIVLQS